ncbi:MAG: radical SAM protein [Nitrososphaeria archaeon]
MYGIQSIDLILTYECNLNCFYCFLNPIRKKAGKEKYLSIEVIDRRLSLIKKEGNEIRNISLYGGEIMLLNDSKYIEDVISVCRDYFPSVSIGVISNLLYVNDKVLNVVLDNNCNLSTSYDSLRFLGNDVLRKKWLSNMKLLSKFVSTIIVLSSKSILEDIEFLKDKIDNSIKLFIIPLFIPEEMEREEKMYIFKFILSPEFYVRSVKYIREKYDNIKLQNWDGGYVFNNIHILPDGHMYSIGPGQRYPYERLYKFSSEETFVFTFSKERIEYISRQISYCLPCSFYPHRCYAEFFYPNDCLGEKLFSNRDDVIY